MPSWYGESVGHYEGDTLVIDTIGLNDRTTIDNFRTPHTDKLHVAEYWKLAEGGEILEVTVRVDDPGTFNAPWSAIQRYRRVQHLGSKRCAPRTTSGAATTPRSPIRQISDLSDSRDTCGQDALLAILCVEGAGGGQAIPDFW